MNWSDRITVDQSVCHGRAFIKGTGTMVSIILDNRHATGNVALSTGVLEKLPSRCMPFTESEYPTG
ncbi:DUF433 domain-containing protein [Thermodesulfobacteriota bacterium]